MNRRFNKLYPNSFTYPALAIYGVFFILPVIAAFMLGFTDWNIDRVFKPAFNGLDNFKYMLEDEYFTLALKNTFIFALLTTLIKVGVGVALALILNKPIAARNFLRTVFYMPAILSMVVIGIMFSAIFRMDGLLNGILQTIGLGHIQIDWLGNTSTALYVTIIAEIWKWSGFTMAIILAGLQSISLDYYESAKIDGASAFQQFRKITLPLLVPALNVAVTFNLIGGLKVFEQVYVITGGGPGNASQVFSTYIFNTFSKGQLGRSTAMGLLLFIVVYSVSSIISSFFRKREIEA